ncbi:sodium/proton antiporter (CPA1 family) [Pseudonocardia sediminis]|uniref:Sodium/proton antiporter (CPA1 family) n=1 Tax=Pseudonocardia sediminis TaxID=1397368 RepID=A0A4Q7UX38_PSEST|nr:Na+/H+ antiporter [Pseudonocardia sediminis]RZT84679.1 sodium/proton antiporter (CPA1 family) [Pseudonocardia sediminis]
MQDAHVLQVLVVVLLAVIVLSRVAKWLNVPAPIVLLLGGVPLAFVPWTSEVTLPPEVVLLLFLPALLYWESLTTSLREIRANLRVVVLSSVVLVLVTAGVVAVVGHALGLSWPVAWVLGAVVAPTDATAVAAVAKGMPRRTLTTLRAESLINDGTALVVFAIAVSVATGEQAFSWPSALGQFGLSYIGGALAGLGVAWLAGHARRIAKDTLLENGISILTPFAAFLLAEEVHASGVLAVVVCGLALSQVGPRTVSARTRLQARAFWQLTTFLLNGTLFVLVGMQLRSALGALESYSLAEGLFDALLVALAVIGTRLLWSNTTPYLIRALDRRPAQRLRRVGARQRLANSWAGFRGGVSLAAALAVPTVLVDGTPFPGRDLIIVVTFGVIAVTLLVQGLTLPAVLRFARLPVDTAEAAEEALAHRVATEAGLAALPQTAARLDIVDEAAARVRADYEDHLHDLTDPSGPGVDDTPTPERVEREDYQRLRAALLADKRAAVVALRDAGKIDDIVLRRVQAGLDAEEVRLAGAADVE